jgi:hypothetical protein
MACSSFAIYGPIVLNRTRDPDGFFSLLLRFVLNVASGLNHLDFLPISKNDGSLLLMERVKRLFSSLHSSQITNSTLLQPLSVFLIPLPATFIEGPRFRLRHLESCFYWSQQGGFSKWLQVPDWHKCRFLNNDLSLLDWWHSLPEFSCLPMPSF